MAEFASKGVAGAGLGLGIAGTALGLGLFNGGLFNTGHNYNGCSENTPVTRYELGQSQVIAEKQAKIDKLEAEQSTDRKILDLYQYVNGVDKATGEAIAQIAAAQAVTNQRFTDEIKAERCARRCADKNIVNYANQTFYAKLIAGINTSNTTTVQETYDPLPEDNCCDC